MSHPPPPSEPKPIQSIEIHPPGDLWLRAPPKRFKVLTAALRLASPVFDCLLDPNGPFKESRVLRANLPEDLVFEEDDPDVLEIILNIIHHKGRRVPTKLAPEAIADVAALSDKYDLASALQGWGALWFGHYEAKDMVEKGVPGMWLEASWRLRSPMVFRVITKLLIVHGRNLGGRNPGDRDQEEDEEEEEVILKDDWGSSLESADVPKRIKRTSRPYPPTFTNLLR